MNIEEFGDIIKISLPTPFPVGDVNVFIVKGERLTLVDAGVKTKAAWEAFTDGLSQAGLVPEDIEQVILTHHHPDHVGMLDFLRDDIHVIGHKYSAPWLMRTEEFMKGHDCFYQELFYQFGLPKELKPSLSQIKDTLKMSCQNGKLTQAVSEGDHLPGLEDWIVFETPGHAQSHLVFFREKDGAMIGGDHVLARISSNPLLEPPLKYGEERPKPQIQYNHSLRKMLDLPIEIVYTGHGEEVKEVHSLVTHRLQRQHDRAVEVRNMLKNGPLTAFEVCVKLFPAVYRKELVLTLSETVAQLDYLQQLGEVSVETNENGIQLYRAVSERVTSR
ncbi:MAG TPA: MBL fold metallo-hydrolase [Chondromyces sp.]|nr:MBL fold metallo-hydrolase [Chondromyces sp.]